MEGMGANKIRKDFIWNTIAGLINASEAVILLMLVTRISGLEDAGILTIAFAIGNLLVTIGKYGIRNFQVTDVEGRYDFHTYLSSRLVTVFLMGLASVGYVLFNTLINGYSDKKAFCIFLICAIYMVEALEDVFWGLYQKKERLYIGCQIFIVRWLSILFSFGLILLWKRNLVLAAGYSLLISIVVELVLIWKSYDKLADITDRFGGLRIREVTSLLKDCFPLFASSFLNFYIINIPKYAIDANLSDEVQACYGFVSMPVFVIGLLNGFIYQPILVKIACEWSEREVKGLRRRIKRQMLIIVGLTAVCEIAAFVAGIPVLSFLYHTDLNKYKGELLVLLLGGGFLAVVGFLATVLTMMRLQKQQLIGYLIVALLATLFSTPFVKSFGVMGAALLYLTLTMLLSMIFIVYVHRGFKGSKEEKISRAG